MKRVNWIFLIFLMGLLVSCKKNDTSGGSLYVPSASDVTANATLEELTQGRALYISNCGTCHRLYSPDDYSATGWKSIMNSMSSKTSMNSSQILLVTKYVCKGKQ